MSKAFKKHTKRLYSTINKIIKLSINRTKITLEIINLLKIYKSSGIINEGILANDESTLVFISLYEKNLGRRDIGVHKCFEFFNILVKKSYKFAL